jgi:uncharacterized protein YndB with AHSA1/START domain
MPRLTRERLVKAPPETVWTLLVDPAQRATWLQSMKEEPAGGGALRVGSRVKARRTAHGSRSTYESVVTRLEPQRLLAMDVSRNGEPAAKGGYELHVAAGGTRVVAFAEYELKGLQKVMGPVVAAGLERELEADLGGLARVAEAAK